MSKKTFLSLTDILPLVVFFIAYRQYDLITATGALVFVSVITTGLRYALERTIATAPLITLVLVVVFGGLTVWLNDERFIKIKPTLLNVSFAAVLLGAAYIYKKGLIQYVMGAVLKMNDAAWLTFSKRWGFFFLFMACLNEVLWRSLPTETWVNVRVFGYMPLTLLFALTQLKFIQAHMIEEEKEASNVTPANDA